MEDVVVSVLSESEVHLTWTPPPGEDIVGYRVERATVEVWTEDVTIDFNPHPWSPLLKELAVIAGRQQALSDVLLFDHILRISFVSMLPSLSI